jgi:hypothetical protein
MSPSPGLSLSQPAAQTGQIRRRQMTRKTELTKANAFPYPASVQK